MAWSRDRNVKKNVQRNLSHYYKSLVLERLVGLKKCAETTTYKACFVSRRCNDWKVEYKKGRNFADKRHLQVCRDVLCFMVHSSCDSVHNVTEQPSTAAERLKGREASPLAILLPLKGSE